MKAIAIDAFGGCDSLRRRGLPTPQPVDDEVRIRVVAAGVSVLDTTARRGALGELAFPWIPGFEVAGTVDALGPRCGRFRPGDKVMALLPRGGGYAECVAVSERHAAPVPASLLFEEAAALPLDGVAAWRALFAGPDPLESTGVATVLDAAGGAGHLAVQLALARGARVRARAAPERRAFVEELGRVEWLEPGGETAGSRVVDPSAAGFHDVERRDGSQQEALAGIAERVAQRRLRPRLFKIFSIGRAAEAHELLESGEVCGKLALTF